MYIIFVLYKCLEKIWKFFFAIELLCIGYSRDRQITNNLKCIDLFQYYSCKYVFLSQLPRVIIVIFYENLIKSTIQQYTDYFFFSIEVVQLFRKPNNITGRLKFVVFRNQISSGPVRGRASIFNIEHATHSCFTVDS